MNKREALLIRIRERISIYRDSPALTVTYVDLAQVLELLADILTENEVKGFEYKKEPQ